MLHYTPSLVKKPLLLFCAVWSLAGCGGPEAPTQMLSTLKDKGLGVIVDLVPSPGQAPAIIADFVYQYLATPCPKLDLAADVDGAAMQLSPNATGSLGNDCQVGYYLYPLPAPAPASRLTITDKSGSVSLTANLLTPREIHWDQTDGVTLPSGTTLSFAWSEPTDTLVLAGAVFTDGTTKQSVPPDVQGNIARVVIPDLTAGVWEILVSATVSVPMMSCGGVKSCAVTMLSQRTFMLTVL